MEIKELINRLSGFVDKLKKAEAEYGNLEIYTNTVASDLTKIFDIDIYQKTTKLANVQKTVIIIKGY